MDAQLGKLVETLESSDGMERKRARETLALVGEPAIPLLRALVSSSDKRSRWEAAKALATLVDPGNVETFLRLLDDPEPDVRWLAGTGLINLGPRVVIPLLTSLLKDSILPGHLHMTRRVLRELSADNEMLAKTVTPVIEMLGRDDLALVTATASRAISELERITGRLP